MKLLLVGLAAVALACGQDIDVKNATVSGNLNLLPGAGTGVVQLKGPANTNNTVIMAFPVNNGAANDCLTTDGTGVLSWAACAAGGANPFADNTPLVKNNADNTKTVTISAASVAAATNRTMTMPNADITLPGVNIANTWSTAQTFSSGLTSGGNIAPSGDGAQDLGLIGNRFDNIRGNLIHGYTIGGSVGELIVDSQNGGAVVRLQGPLTADAPVSYFVKLPPKAPTVLNECMTVTDVGAQKLEWSGVSCIGGGGGGGITTINGQAQAAQTLVTGSAGTDFAINSAGGVHTFNIPSSSAANRGLLTAANWSTFNGKVSSVAGDGSTISSSGGQTPTISAISPVQQNGTYTNVGLTFRGATGFLNTSKLEVTQSAGGAFYYFTMPDSNTMRLIDNSGTLYQEWTTAGPGNLVQIAGSIYPTGTRTLGLSGFRWDELWTSKIDGSSTLNMSGAATLGSTLGVTGATTLSSTLGVTGETTLSNKLTVGSAATFNGGIVTGGGTSSNINMGIGGEFSTRPFAGGDVACLDRPNGWIGVRTDTEEIQVCIGGVVKKAALL